MGMINLREALVGVNHVLCAGWDNPKIAGKGQFTPKWIMLHHTGGVGGGVLPDILAGHPDYPGIPKANIFIDRAGVAHICSQFVTYHAGTGGPLGSIARNEMNHWSYGFEMESWGRVRDFTPAQMDTLALMARNLLRTMGEPASHVINHSDWSTTGKVDTRYDINELRKLIANYKEPPMVANDDFLSLKSSSIRTVRTNTDIAIRIGGKDRWRAEELSGRHGLAIYVNHHVAKLTQLQRDALWYGGIMTWYQQLPGPDPTGANGPTPFARFGTTAHRTAHSWPHTVDSDYWQFMYRLFAYTAGGKHLDFNVDESITEIKIIGDRT
jgi:hypothetical protein